MVHKSGQERGHAWERQVLTCRDMVMSLRCGKAQITAAWTPFVLVQQIIIIITSPIKPPLHVVVSHTCRTCIVHISLITVTWFSL